MTADFAVKLGPFKTVWTWERRPGYLTLHLLPPDPGDDALDDRWYCGPRDDDPGDGPEYEADTPEPWPVNACKTCQRAYLAHAGASSDATNR